MARRDNLRETFEALDAPSISMLSEQQMDQLLKRARTAAQGRLKTISKEGLDPLISNSANLTASLRGLTEMQKVQRLRQYKTFFTSEKSSASGIKKALERAYQTAIKGGGLPKIEGAIDPSQVVSKKVTVNGKEETRYYTKEGKRVYLRFTLAGGEVFIARGKNQDLRYSLKSKEEFSALLTQFNKLYENGELQAHIPSDARAILIWYAIRGQIGGYKGKKDKSGNYIYKGKSGIVDNILATYDAWRIRKPDYELADQKVYDALTKKVKR